MNGVLFLDELGEYPTKLLEVLRQPLEDGKIIISRSDFVATYPVNMLFITATNPTPSGYFADDLRCTDSLRDIKRYMKKFSGPLLDRMDIYVELKKLTNEEMLNKEKGEASSDIRTRVKHAREIQLKRYERKRLNNNMTKKDLEKYCKLDHQMEELMRLAIDKFNLSARSFDKILKVSRTIADLEDIQDININHISEALNYRKK